eukprot:2978186-Pyramimonas_sp.AAC.1
MAALKWVDNRARQLFGLYQSGDAPRLRGVWTDPPRFVLDGIGVHRPLLDDIAATASAASSITGIEPAE